MPAGRAWQDWGAGLHLLFPSQTNLLLLPWPPARFPLNSALQGRGPGRGPGLHPGPERCAPAATGLPRMLRTVDAGKVWKLAGPASGPERSVPRLAGTASPNILVLRLNSDPKVRGHIFLLPGSPLVKANLQALGVWAVSKRVSEGCVHGCCHRRDPGLPSRRGRHQPRVAAYIHVSCPE